ncbi:large subunit GTPase 1 homolog [Lampetra fluviatilis]
MGKKKQGPNLGRSIIKDRNNASRTQRKNDSWLHTSELNDGYDWGRLNLQSVTEQSALDEFLSTAELAGTEFTAEKLNIKVVSEVARTGVLSDEESQKMKLLHESNKHFLNIPRRPRWDASTTTEALQLNEREDFLAWRRQLAILQEKEELILTPFERNLDFWRQLWRVIERSDVVVQIVDARNPLLFRCEDLERYVTEVSPHKDNLILVNKADLLSEGQRQAWADFFEAQDVRVVFWSALHEAKRLEAEAQGLDEYEQQETEGDGSDLSEEDTEPEDGTREEEEKDDRGQDEARTAEKDGEDLTDGWETCDEDEDDSDFKSVTDGEESWQDLGMEESASAPRARSPVKNSSRLLHQDELLLVFRNFHVGPKVKRGQTTIGLVGYPNVGKSSTINTILQNKKVPVSATPGRTKHFQTLFVDSDLCLCDCPGLVMPSFVSTKAEMACSGILPIDQMRDHVPPVSLVCQHIPRAVLEATYGINIVRPREDEDPDRPPTSEELLSAYGYMRGYMTAHGQPDQPRSARYILKDYVNGKLLFCYPPPGFDVKAFQHQHMAILSPDQPTTASGSQGSKPKVSKAKCIVNEVDKSFFHQDNVRAFTKGVRGLMGPHPGGAVPHAANATPAAPAAEGKPWKKHGNRNKKEKVRRLCKHLDN